MALETFLLAVAVTLMVVAVRAIYTMLSEQRENHRTVLKMLWKHEAALKSLRDSEPASKPAPVPEPKVVVAPEPIAEIAKPEPFRPPPLAVRVQAPAPVPVIANSAIPVTEAEEEPEPEEKADSAAAQVLRRAWNWIIVGKEYRQPGMKLEYAVAANWLLRIGIAVFVLGMGFFLRYSIDQGWLGPAARVALGVIIGSVMLSFGVRQLGKRYNLIGQGLIGGGLATLYFSIFTAAQIHALIPLLAGYALMAAVTLCAGVIAVRQDAILIAVLGVLGGFGTPIMLTGTDWAGQFGYLLVLALGVLGVSAYKNWRVLNALSFVATYGVGAWVLRHAGTGDSAVVLGFLIACFVIYSTLVFLPHLMRRERATVLEVIALVVNAAVFAILARPHCFALGDKSGVALMALAISVYYAAHFGLWLKRSADRTQMLSFLGLSAAFLAITIPLYFSRNWLSATWAVQSLLLLWLALRLGSNFLKRVACLLFGCVIFQFVTYDLGMQYAAAKSTATFGEFATLLLERMVVFCVPIGTLLVGYRMLRNALPEEEADEPAAMMRDHSLAQTALVVAVAMAFVFCQVELFYTVGRYLPDLRNGAVTSIWVALAAGLLLAYRRTQHKGVLDWLVLFSVVATVKLIIDLGFWGINDAWIYRADYTALAVLGRTLDAALVAGFLLVAYRGLKGDIARLYLAAGLVLTAVLLTLEVNTALLVFLPDMQAGGISILWAGFALTLVHQGMVRSVPMLRYAGLGMFVIVIGKVFFNDLAALHQLYRIVAFLVLGVLILGGSFLYVHFQRQPE